MRLGLLRRLGEHGIDFRDLQTRQSSLEEIFVSLVSGSGSGSGNGSGNGNAGAGAA